VQQAGRLTRSEVQQRMPDSESFEAFYARTVGNVTSQMHALAGDDGAADHALREAYARAYQQWYEIGSYPDTEGWVLAVAREAYQRRRPMAAAPARDPARPGHDPLSMPGLFRPAPRAASGGTGETTVAPPADRAEERQNGWFTPTSRPAGAAADAGGGAQARGVAGLFGGRAVAPAAPSTTATARLAGDQPAVSGQPGGQWRPKRPAGLFAGRRRPSATLIALVVVVALGAAAGVGYLIAGGHPAKRPTSPDTAAAQHGKPAVQMLGAGKTGNLSAIPWSLIGTGWTLAEVSTAQPGPDGTATSGGTVTTYLVDPVGGKYQIQSSPGPAPVLLGWSGNAQEALFEVPPGSSSTGVGYELLSLTTGSMSALSLPAGVSAVGFTRPDGLNILAVNQTATAYQLERFNLQGTYQATIGSLPVKQGVTPNWPDCGMECGALSSPTGLYAVWGVAGDEMQLVSNAGGPVIRRLSVPDSGSPSSCVPVTWWSTDAVLASCGVTGQPSDVARLWLVPADGTTPTPVTDASGSPSGTGTLTGAWQAAGAVYVNSTDFAECASAASGPGGLAAATVSGGSLRQLSVRGTTNNHTSVVSAVDGRLLLLAETSCPGSSALLWLNPSTGATQTLLSAPASEVGVVAAAPFGLGPTATGVGLDG
jgi:hypothetical protein